MTLHNTSTRILSLNSLALSLFIIASGCAQTETVEIEREFNAPELSEAVAVLHTTEGFEAEGTVYFRAVENGVQVTAELSGLSEGNKGFHIHQYGDCTAANGTSAGGHFNPEGLDHAGPTDAMRHMGDMGNITADAQGNARCLWRAWRRPPAKFHRYPQRFGRLCPAGNARQRAELHRPSDGANQKCPHRPSIRHYQQRAG